MERAMALPRSACVLVVFLAFPLAAPASALSAPLYASPAGTGGCSSESDSCDLPTAVSTATGGDDVYVRGDQGDYALSAELTNAAAVNYHGTHGRPRLIFSGAAARLKLQAGSSADNLYVEMSGSNADLGLYLSRGNNLIVQHTGHEHAIFLQDSTLTNSVAWTPISTGTGEQSIELEKSNTVRNVTAYAPAAGGIAIVALGRGPPGNDSATDDLVNVIARGGPGGAGIRLYEADNVDLTVNVSHSNYSSADVDTGSDDVSMANLNADGTNQTGPPLFAGAAAGDFHQAFGSVTIDGGANSVANGTTDFDGDARTLNGTTDIGADESIPGPAKPPAAPDCAYGNPNCATTCTNPTTLLVSCPDLSGAAGLCQGQLYPQCLHPVVPQTRCRRTGGLVECSQTTPGDRPAAGSCASMGQALPECNVPTREVPVACHSGEFNLDPQPGQVCFAGAHDGPISNCPPPSPAVTPACNFPNSVTVPTKPKGATAAARRGTRLTVTIGCPKVLAKPRCKGTVAVDGLRASLLRTLRKQARYSAGTYRFFVPGLAGFAGPFQKAANAITKRVLGGTKLPKPVKTAAIVAELARSDPQTKSYAASLQRAVKEYRKLAGRAKKRRGSKRAEASRTTTTFKRFSLKSGRKRARIRVRLSAATVRLLRRDAAKRGRAPVRVIVSFKAAPRPVVRFVDLALRVR
jgi:hypothetical protein